jgi:hypothetical protein
LPAWVGGNPTIAERVFVLRANAMAAETGTLCGCRSYDATLTDETPIRRRGVSAVIGMSSLPKNLSPQAVPKLNRKRAVLVVSKIDEILAWEKAADQERSARYLDLGRYLCEVRTGQYWRLDNLRSFDEFLERKFPQSRRKAYYLLLAIHEGLPRKIHRALQEVGWTKAVELAKIARKEAEDFDCETWLHKAQDLTKEEFKTEVKKHLTGKHVEPRELLYFQVSKNQLAVIEQALETAASILGAKRSRGYCFEMICADFVAGESRESGAEDVLFGALTRLVDIFPVPQRLRLLDVVKKNLESVQTGAPDH